jgi:hypothetical protein
VLTLNSNCLSEKGKEVFGTELNEISMAVLFVDSTCGCRVMFCNYVEVILKSVNELL